MMFYHADSFKRHCIGTELKFVWLPKRCYLSKKIIWLKIAYKQTAMYMGPSDVVFDHRWYNKNQFLLARLTGEV